MADRVIQRNDTAARWQSINPILATGEIGIEIDGAKGYKIGDGKTRWNDLPYPANPTNVVQELGNNENAVPSQKLVTEKLSELGSEVIYDVTANNNGATFASLSALLSDENLSTLIPSAVRCGGISIRFVLSSDNKYVQYRLTSDTFSINTEDWTIADEGVYVENPEFVYVKLDAKGKILWAIKVDGSIYYGAGVPQQVIDYITEKVGNLTSDKVEDILSFLNGLYTGDTTLQQLLSNKVDKIEGKSLIDAEHAESLSHVEDTEYVQVELDSKNKILGGRKSDGTKFENVAFEVGGYLTKNIENAEFVTVDVDSNNKVHHAISKDGSHIFPAGIKSPTLTDLEKKIPTKEDIKSYVGGADLLPNSWKKSISSIQESQGKNFIFAVQTDTHAVFTESSDGIGNKPNDEYYAANLKSLTNYIGLDFICNLGDIIQGYSYEQDSNAHTRDNMTEIVKRYCSGVSCPMLFCQGNHDSNYLWANKNSEVNIGEAERYAKLIKPSKNTCNNFADNNKSLYFYVDFDDVRVIFLNSQDNGDNSWNFNISEAQVVWFSEVALNTTKQIIVASHAPLVNQLIKDADSTEVTITDVPTRAVDVLNAIYTFKQNGGNVIGCISGHTHYQSHNKINEINHINFKNGGDKAEVVIVDIENKTITTKSLPNGELVERTFNY